MKNKSFYLVISFLSGLILLFIIAHLIGMLLATSPSDIFQTLKDSEVTGSVWVTLGASTLATVIFAIAAVPFAY